MELVTKSKPAFMKFHYKAYLLWLNAMFFLKKSRRIDSKTGNVLILVRNSRREFSLHSSQQLDAGLQKLIKILQ